MKEHDIVKSLIVLPFVSENTIGTIIHNYKSTNSYEVEFVVNEESYIYILKSDQIKKID